MAVDNPKRATTTTTTTTTIPLGDGRSLPIDELKKRYEALNTRKITAEANLITANNELETLKREAKEKYGTDDLEELERKLTQMREDNERRRAEYQHHLEEIEGKLADVERQFAAPQKKE